jgi:hypothetical protein
MLSTFGAQAITDDILVGRYDIHDPESARLANR